MRLSLDYIFQEHGAHSLTAFLSHAGEGDGQHFTISKDDFAKFCEEYPRKEQPTYVQQKAVVKKDCGCGSRAKRAQSKK